MAKINLADLRAWAEQENAAMILLVYLDIMI